MAIAYTATAELIATSRSAARHADVLAALERVFFNVYQAESTQRGYLLTDDPELLRDRSSAHAATLAALEALGAELTVEAEGRRELARVERLVNERLDLLDQLLEVYRQEGLDAARELLAAGFGRPQMRALHRQAELTIGQRQALLEDSVAAAERATDRVVLSLLATLGFVVILLAALMAVIRRTLRKLRRSNASLVASQARLDALVETAVDPLIVIDEQGIMEGFNRAAERTFGYRADEALGRNVAILMPSPDRERHDEYLRHYLRTGERRIIGIGREVLAQRKDGRVFPAELAVAEFWAGGKRRFSGIVRDISERRQAETQRNLLVRDLEAANAELESFAYVASHDLKAPLRAIATLAEWISTDYADKFDDEGQEQMRLLIGRVQRMDRLIDGILQYSRVGRVRQETAPVALNPLLDEVIDLLDPPPHIQIEVESLPTVVGERTRIQQVFQNLLSNAIRYMDKPEGRIHVGSASANGMWRFCVSDNGPGIDERHRERIFQLFQTLAPRDRTESTGIGLSLVKKIVELYGGRVWLDSTPGEGTTFCFTWPKSAAARQGAR